MSRLSRLKLCFLAGTLEHGGAERQLFYILQALCKAGATPRLLSLDQGGFWEEPIRDLGVPITWVGNRSSRFGRLFRILKELRNDPPDVLQSQHFFVNAYVGAAARILQAIGIGAMRSNGHSEVTATGAFGGWLNLRLPQIIAANSKTAIDYAIARGVPASRFHFLPNVVDTDRFTPSDAPSNGPLTLVAVGRLVKCKRLDRFISILARVRRNFGLNVRGLIVGPESQGEPVRPELECQAAALGLYPGALEFRGGVSDMRSIYQESQVCILTSDFEGTPNVLLEAMAAGLPVISTNVGGVPGIVRHGETGFLFAPDDLDGLTAVTAELASNSELRTKMGQRAREFVEENHSVHRLPAFLTSLYELALPARWPAAEPVRSASI